MSADHFKSISVDQLRVGMFVTKLDISWLDSPFLSHSRLIKDTSDIESLKSAGVKVLVIDISRGVAPEAMPPPPSPPVAPAQVMEVAPIVTAPLPIVTPPLKSPQQRNRASISSECVPNLARAVSFEKEFTAAVHLRAKIKRAIEDLQRDFEADTPVHVATLVPLVNSTLESLARNDQALMSLVHLNRQAQKVADHVFGTFCLVLNLALVRKVPEQEREQLGLAALLHEAGWTQLPLNLIGKRTRYTKTEAALVKKHTLIGDQILARSELPELTRRLVAEHHELLDGSGYPRGLTAAAIHPLSQLLSVADTYEERVHQLTDEPGVIPTNALRSLYRDAERGAFSAEVVAAFIGMLGIYPATTLVQLSTGEKAVVKQHHADAPLLPQVIVLSNADGSLCDPPMALDLRRQPGDGGRAIKAALDPQAPAHEWVRRLIATEEWLGV